MVIFKYLNDPEAGLFAKFPVSLHPSAALVFAVFINITYTIPLLHWVLRSNSVKVEELYIIMTLEFAGMIVDAVTSIVEQPVKVMPGLDEKTVPPAPPSINKVAEPENGGGFDEPYENWKSVAFIDAPPVLKVINSFVPSCEPQALIIAPVIYGH